jgi:hypothetical protein
MSAIQSKDLTINYSNIETHRISSTELQENERSKGQKLAFPRFNHPALGPDQPLMMQFPWIKIESYGIPRAGEYFKTDNDRAFIKVPLNPNIPESLQLINKIKEIDAYFKSDEFATTLLGKKYAKWTYQPIYREQMAVADEDSDEEVAPKKILITSQVQLKQNCSVQKCPMVSAHARKFKT